MLRSMPTDRGGDASRLSGSMRTLFAVGSLCGLTDGQLLERFLRGRGDAEAEAAFTALVERHGPMVLGVCRAVLGDRHDAEDACQAAFLVLARRAGTIRRGDSVASWLYGVARRLALRARRDAARRALERRRLERTGSAEPVAAPPAEPWPELYEELDRLPQPFRAAVVLCDLEGHSYEQAAGLLHCPVGTVQSRLARGRQRLRGRLERRGIAPAVALVGSGATLAARPTAAAMSPQLTAAIARSAIGIGAGRTIAASAPAAVAAMAGAELRRLVMTRVATTLMMLLVAGLAATVAIVLAAGGRGEDPKHQADAAAEKKADTGPIHVRAVDLDGRSVAGVAVEWRGWDQPVRSFTTDADGRATIPRDLLSDRGYLVARRGHDAFAWGGVGDSEPNRPAGTADDPIVMELLPLDHRVEGSVVDREGRPIAGVAMRAFAFDHPVNGSIQFETVLQGLLAPAITDREGRFVVSLPRGAQASLYAVHPRYVGPTLGVEPGARALDPAVLDPAGSIAGRVIDGATGQPVAGAVLGAQLVEHRPHIIGGWVETTSDDQGRFLLGGAEPGVYNLLFHGIPGRTDAAARAVECVRVRAGADTPADLVVTAGRPLRGVVIDRDTGQPVPGIEVGCYGPARPRSGAAVESHKADDQGRFTFHVPPGEQYVYLMEGGSNTRLSHRNVIVPEQGEIEPVRLMRWTHRAQNPMMEYTKTVARPDVKKAAEPPPVEPARAEAPGVSKKAVPPRDQPVVGEVEAKPPPAAPRVRTVTGHVRDPHGRPLAGVQLQAAPDPFVPGARPQDFGLPTTDREGLVLFPDLPRRPLKITLTRRGYRYQSEDLPADRDEVQWTFVLVPDPRDKDLSAPSQDEPIPPGLRDRLTFVDLEPRGTDYLTDGPGGNGNDLNRLPRGIHKLGETYFRIDEKMVHLSGRERPDLPDSVKGIKVRARGRVLHFLHSTQGGADSDDKLIGAYVIHYSDGSMETASFAYARDITNWWHRDPGRRLTRARAAWTGLNDVLEQHPRPGLYVRLFDMTWTNPHPDKEIATLDVLATGKECDPFLVALTLQRDE